jgi:hypothetical protein
VQNEVAIEQIQQAIVISQRSLCIITVSFLYSYNKQLELYSHRLPSENETAKVDCRSPRIALNIFLCPAGSLAQANVAFLAHQKSLSITKFYDSSAT